MLKTTLILISFLLTPFLPQDVILSNTYETHQHNIGTNDNVVYLHQDGHQEAVYNSSGNLVADSVNEGSYNLCHPIKESLCHFREDTLPWIIWGNSPEDTSKMAQRIDAFWKDYQHGVIKSIFRVNK